MEWVRQFNNMWSKIDDAISIHHGILCERRNDRISYNARDKLLFHICDVIVMLCQTMTSTGTGQLHSFRILSPSMGGLNLGMISDDFVGTLSTEERFFLFNNADFFYVLYGYWANHSMLPIRLNCPSMLVNASRLSNTFRFVDHMEGKLIQLRREQRALIDKRLFML